MKIKLVEFDLSIRILLPLESAGIITLGDLTSQNKLSLLKNRSLGKRSIEVLQNLLDRLDLSFSQ